MFPKSKKLQWNANAEDSSRAGKKSLLFGLLFPPRPSPSFSILTLSPSYERRGVYSMGNFPSGPRVSLPLSLGGWPSSVRGESRNSFFFSQRRRRIGGQRKTEREEEGREVGNEGEALSIGDRLAAASTNVPNENGGEFHC